MNIKSLVLLGCLSFFITSFGINKNKIKYAETSVSVLDFGAVGDGITDDSDAFQKAIIYCIKNEKILYVPKTKHNYSLTKTIRVELSKNDKIKIISNNAVILPVDLENRSAYNLTSFKEHIFISIGRKINSIRKIEKPQENSGTEIDISGLIFDGRKNKYNEKILSFDNDIYIGAQLIAEKVRLSDCTFKNIFGYGVRIHEVSDSRIEHCKFINVGGRGGTPFANNIDFDGFGDAIYHAKVNGDANILISDCKISGKKYNDKRSRCAITFEYSEFPYKVNLEKLDISGYAKCLHIEEVAATIFHIKDVKMTDFNFGIANVLNNKTEIFLNNCTLNVGFNDGNDNGDALAFLNYRSFAKIYVSNSKLNFNGRHRAYQSAVGLAEVKNSTINGNNTNFFFADGNTVFSRCKFVNFGGPHESFKSNHSNNVYTIEDSKFFGTSLSSITGNNVKVIITRCIEL